jgi:hypothetical protein
MKFNVFSQNDSLNYYSKIFKDTGVVCIGERTIAFNYISKKITENKTSIKFLKKYLNIETVTKNEDNSKEYSYVLDCNCFYNEKRERKITSCEFVRIIVFKRKIIKIEYYGIP